MSVSQYGLECEPGGQPTVLGPTPEPTHTGCPGGSNTPGLIGGWTCPCGCHRNEPAALPPYVPIERVDILVRCQRCGAVVEGDVVGQNQHDIWHTSVDRRIDRAGRWKPAPRYGGAVRGRSQTSTGVDDVPADRASEVSAQTSPEWAQTDMTRKEQR